MVICLKNSYAFQNFGKHYCKVLFQFSIGLPSDYYQYSINIFFLSSVSHSWQSPGWHICPLEDSLRLIPTFEHSFIASCSSYQIHDPIFLKSFLLYLQFADIICVSPEASNSLLGICLTEMHMYVHQETYSRMFIAVQLIIACHWKIPKCSQTIEWIKKP